eukprot:SAG31_NODE_20255_length_579_cov_3.804167_1_plen_101_part_00
MRTRRTKFSTVAVSGGARTGRTQLPIMAVPKFRYLLSSMRQLYALGERQFLSAPAPAARGSEENRKFKKILNIQCTQLHLPTHPDTQNLVYIPVLSETRV